MSRLLLAAVSLFAVNSLAAPLKVETYNAGPGGFLVTSTLITGEKDAVLVDAQFTLADAHRVAAMVLESGKTLKTIVITHGHPDHFFGLEVLKAAFPRAKVLASRKVVAETKTNGPGSVAYWKPHYGAALCAAPTYPEVFEGKRLELEGQALELLEVNDGESPAATAVWIPSIKTLVAGDAVYDGVHAWLADGTTQARRDAWAKNLEAFKALGPEVVIGGHRAEHPTGTAAALDEQLTYLRDFSAAVKRSKTPEALAKAVSEQHPLALPVILDLASKASVQR